MSDSAISVQSIDKVLEISESEPESLKKRSRYEGENSGQNTPKTAKGMLSRSKSADDIEKLRESTENNAKGFQKLHEKVKDISRKLVDQKTSEASVTWIRTQNGYFGESTLCRKQEWQVLSKDFKKRILTGNTCGDSGLKTEEKKVEVMGYIAKRPPSGSEAMGCEKLDEIQEAAIDQIMRELEDVDKKVENQVKEIQRSDEVIENQVIEIQKLHEKLEDLRRMSDTGKIRTKKRWSFEVDLCTMKDLEVMTDSFNEENFIGDTTYGKLYRGKLKLDSTGSKTKDVVVKIWDDKVDYIDDGKVVKEELRFLANSSNHHQNLPKLITFCNNGECSPGRLNGVVYDINPLDRLFSCIPKDNFSWIQRVKVAFELAMLLQSLQEPDRPYVLFDMDTQNILLNQEYSPIMVDFGVLCGGLKGGPRLAQESGHMPFGFNDPYLENTRLVRIIWNDVYSYGIILLGLLTKRVDSKEIMDKSNYHTYFLSSWATREYSGDGCSLVESTLTEDKNYEVSDGIALTKLAMDCIRPPDDNYSTRQSRPFCNGIILSITLRRLLALFSTRSPLRKH